MLTPAWQEHGPRVRLAPRGRLYYPVAAKACFLPLLPATPPLPSYPLLFFSKIKEKSKYFFWALSHDGQAARERIFENSGNTWEVKPTSWDRRQASFWHQVGPERGLKPPSRKCMPRVRTSETVKLTSFHAPPKPTGLVMGNWLKMCWPT